jgi:hypothetical protein
MSNSKNDKRDKPDKLDSSDSSDSSNSADSADSASPVTTNSPDIVIHTTDEMSEQNEEESDIPVQAKLKSKEEQKVDRVKILKRLDELRKRKRENEYFIRVSQQTIKYRTQELQREIRRRYNRIRRIRQGQGKDMYEFDDLLEPIHYETVGATAIPIIEPTRPQPLLPRMKMVSRFNNEDGMDGGANVDEETEEDITVSEVDGIRSEIDLIKERISQEIEDIRFEIEEKKIENGEIDKLMRNNWDPQNTATVTKWIKEGDKQSFIYDRVRDSLQHRVKILTVIIMIMSGIQSLLSVSRFGLDETKHTTLTLVFNIIGAVISTMVFMITTYIKDSKFEDVIQSLTSYVEKLEAFLSGLVSIADIKPELRPDGDSFVSERRETYAEIYREAPNISQRQLQHGIRDYKEYVLNVDPEKEIHCSRKRANYAYFARQTVEESDIHSVWSGHHPNEIESYGNNGQRGLNSRPLRRKVTPSEDRRNDINRSLKTGNVDVDSHGITGSTDGDDDKVVIDTHR